MLVPILTSPHSSEYSWQRLLYVQRECIMYVCPKSLTSGQEMHIMCMRIQGQFKGVMSYTCTRLFLQLPIAAVHLGTAALLLV